MPDPHTPPATHVEHCGRDEPHDAHAETHGDLRLECFGTPAEAAPGDWPRGVVDPACPSGHRIETPTDHRLLWHLENEISAYATTEVDHQLARRLREYLNATCQHHWHYSEADEDYPAHRQCLWCNVVQQPGEYDQSAGDVPAAEAWTAANPAMPLTDEQHAALMAKIGEPAGEVPAADPEAPTAERLAEIRDMAVDSLSGDAPYNPDVWALEAARRDLLAEVDRLRRIAAVNHGLYKSAEADAAATPPAGADEAVNEAKAEARALAKTARRYRRERDMAREAVARVRACAESLSEGAAAFTAEERAMLRYARGRFLAALDGTDGGS